MESFNLDHSHLDRFHKRYTALITVCSLSVNCNDLPISSQEYMEWLTRYRFYPFAAGAYSDHPEYCLGNVSINSLLINRYEVDCDAVNSTCSGYLAVSPGDQAIVLAFRGTNSETQLAFEESEIPKGIMSQWSGGGQVSQYYYNGFNAVWYSGMSNDVQRVSNAYKGYQLWITGHSLGGSLAALGASYILHNHLFDKNRTFLTTFGEPRVGDCIFADSFNKDLSYSYRIVHANDEFALAGSNSATFCHHKTEVWYPRNMTTSSPFFICPTECNPDPETLSFDDHIYFEKQIMDYGRGGCVD